MEFTAKVKTGWLSATGVFMAMAELYLSGQLSLSRTSASTDRVERFEAGLLELTQQMGLLT